jgi:CBS domain-containing protein
MSKQIIKYLENSPHFKFLPRGDIAKLAAAAEIREYNNNDILAKQDQTELDHIYVLSKGQLTYIHENQGQRLQLGNVMKGDVLGGISLLMNGGVSMRSVEAYGKARCYLIPKGLFLDLCARSEELYEYFLENYNKNMVDSTLAKPIENLALKRFLMDAPPFSFLPEDEIAALGESTATIHHNIDKMLFIKDKSRIGYLYILKKGSAEVSYYTSDQKTMNGMLSEGDIYGGVSILLNNGISMRNLKVKKDSEFYIIPKHTFLDLCARYEIFYQCLLQTDTQPVLCRAIITKTMQPQNETLQLFNQPVTSLYSPKFSLGHVNMTIRQAAKAMRRDKTSFLLIEDTDKKRHGIVTEGDLTRRVIAGEIDTAQKIKKVMSSPLLTISRQSPVFEALMTMMQKDVRRLAVTDTDGRIVGILSNREILAAQDNSPLFMLRQIAQAQDMEAIIDKHKQMPGLIRSLIANGANAQNVTRIITTLSDAILNKLMQFTIKELGAPPARFVFMLMGSEGRKEQTLKTDQDNAIIYEDVPTGRNKVRDYFLKFGEIASNLLNQAGYDYCQGDVMSKNPKWCQPLSVWKKYFSDWIHAAEPEDLLQASIFFDFRGGFGDLDFTVKLREHLFASLGGWSGFLWHLTENALHYKPPLGFFRNFVVEPKGAHRDAFDIKGAIMPIVDFARVYALKHRIEETNTWERIHRLRLKQVLSQKESEELERAYSFLMQLRFGRQVEAVIEKNSKPDNYINPKKLTDIEQTTLKQIFKHVEKFQAKMKFDFIGA